MKTLATKALKLSDSGCSFTYLLSKLNQMLKELTGEEMSCSCSDLGHRTGS